VEFARSARRRRRKADADRRSPVACGILAGTMAREHIEVVRSAFAAWEEGDLARLGDLVTDDLVVYRADPDGATSHGLDGFLELTADWTEGFADWTPVPEEFTEVGERVLVRVRQSARGEASGVPLTEDWWFVYELRRARIARMSIYTKHTEALEAAGASSAP
jgi:ketosteroid isomerase-like protein